MTPGQWHGRAFQRPDLGSPAKSLLPDRQATGSQAASIRLALKPETPAICLKQQAALVSDEGMAHNWTVPVQEEALLTAGMWKLGNCVGIGVLLITERCT